MIRVSFADIQQAQKRISGFIKNTSFVKSEFFSQKAGAEVFLKWETEQKIKSFKIRGALNKVFALLEGGKKKNLIAASAGNHAQGVALAAFYSKAKARIVMMEEASQVKVEATKKWGAEVILKGKTYDESYAHARSIQGDSLFIHPYADPLIIAGQGTVALELLEKQPDLSSLIIGIGGGGLISGVALGIKTLKPDCKIYGVVWEGTPEFCRTYHQVEEHDSCRCGKKETQSFRFKSGITDGIAVKNLAPEMLQFCRPFIEDVVCVSEQEISQVMASLFHHEKKVVEGSGAAALAALIKNKSRWNIGNKCGVIISGGNIDSSVFHQTVKDYGKNLL